jgi:hypothetical protein
MVDLVCLAARHCQKIFRRQKGAFALEARGLGPVSINARITAVRKLAVEAAESPEGWTGARPGPGVGL